MNRTILGAALALGTITALALATPAAAHHNQPDVTMDGPGDCGQLTIAAAWPVDEHQVDNTALVVQVDGEQHVADVGEDITVGPFDADQTISWRVWGGGERDYDSPPLLDLDALVAHLDAGGGELDEDAPGVAWHTVDVTGCPVETAPSPTPEPEPEPSADPTPAPTSDTGATPPPAADDEELPATGVPALGLAGAGLVLLTVGTVAVVATRRRRTTFTS